MYQTQYRTPPPGYAFDYRQTPSPSPNARSYYSARFGTTSPKTPPSTKQRRSSQSYGYGYSSAQQQQQQQQQQQPFYNNYAATPEYYSSAYTSPRPKAEYVSSSARMRSTPKSRFYERDGGFHHGGDKRYASRTQHMYEAMTGDYFHDYYSRDAPPPYERYQYDPAATDYQFYDQVPRYTPEPEATAHRSRARRASHGARPQPQPQPAGPPKAARPSSAKAPRKATDEDARRAGIPAGYSVKNWDPSEEPIMLLGSVFDANSLGKWIYDWTVFHHGANTPMSDVSGDLWLLLIQLAGKVKRAEECLPRIRRVENKELVEDFLEAGERLWDRFGRLLKVCESYMWKAARRTSGEKKNITMGKNSGCEFVDSMFGRDRQLENTEKLMTGMRLWSMRFDANCEDILRRPHV